MADVAFEQQFVETVASNTKRMKALADRAMVFYVLLRLGLVVGSAMLPALTTISDRIWSTGVAVLVAIFAGLDTQFRWGEEWRHFRSTQLTLERLRRDYEHGAASLSAGMSAGDIKNKGDNFERFYQNVSTLLQTEADSFFKFRIVAWKNARA